MNDLLKENKVWQNFRNWFWLLFSIKFLGYLTVYTINTNGKTFDYALIIVIAAAIQLLAIIAMVIVMGYYGYKFVGKWHGMLYGLLGTLWVGFFLLAIGYFALKDQAKKYSLNKLSLENNN